MKPISYGRQHITAEDIEAVVEALQSDYLTQGPRIAAFEKEFAAYCETEYCVMVSNGTAALHLCALALDIKQGDRIITTPITFVASANGFRYCGAEIVFCDINPDSYLLDLDKLEDLLSKSPKGYYKGVVPVDFAGYPLYTERLRALADQYGLWIVEDACHAPGGYYIDSKGERQLCGNNRYVDMTVFSFHPVKHIATGEGGAITTNNKHLYDRLMLYRTHGITKDPDMLSKNDGGWYMEMVDLGYNYRITDMQAALGSSQLKRNPDGIIRRQQIADRYNEAFRAISQIQPPKVEAGIQHAYHLYVIQVTNRRELYDYLKSQNIYSQVHYIPAHLMPYYIQLGHKKGECPIAERYYERCLSLPMYPSLTDEEQEYVIAQIIQFVQS